MVVDVLTHNYFVGSVFVCSIVSKRADKSPDVKQSQMHWGHLSNTKNNFKYIEN